MTVLNTSAEREPLLQPSISPTLTNREGKDDEPAISTLRGALIVGSVGLLIFLQATNISIITTTQSSIAADLDAFETASWFTSSYLIAMSSLAPLMGRLCQVFSPRLCMFFSTMLIAIGSAITSTSVSFEHFIIGRVVTGAGGGGIFIVASIMAIQMTSPKRRGLYMGLANTAMTVGVSLGAVIAGALEPRIGWKPLFGIQAPISFVAGLGLLFSIPASHTSKNIKYENLSIREKLARIDYSGALLLTTTIVLFLLGLSGPRVLPTPIILSALALPVFVLNEAYVAGDPVIPVSVLRSRGTLLTCLGTTGFMMARWSILFYTPVYALAVRGWAPAVAGSILIPTNAGFATGGLLAGVFHIKRTGSFYLHTVVAMALFPITMAVLALISTPSSPWGLYVAMVFLNGLVTGAATNYALVHLLHLTLPEVHPIVISLLATFRGFSGSFGSAIGGGYFVRVLHKSLDDGFAQAGLRNRGELTRRLLGSPALVGKLEGKDRVVAVGAYADALKALFLCAVGLSIVVVLVQAGTGWKEPAKSESQREEEEIEAEDGVPVGA
ncbi:major facilitator superfamily domain-containing protein [Alternaria rosae]|uniref:major facilitator superfamily domain-containing protein n=1 Tax=Alternaria rosae TaxID=1187941 RepID=UPI001E8E76A2|nr:major facilitator superfamily domain-containing protein [Alternaria rosae]KAH6878766.1 major facilitator superfamily domain-containing protein [Alternaria rosae]